MYTTPIHIKQEIQIPQVTSMTSSPDSSPSPLNPTGTGSGSGGNAANPGENGGQSQAANNAEIVAVLAGGGGGVPIWNRQSNWACCQAPDRPQRWWM